MTFSCVVLPAELVSRELDAAKSTVARFEHLDHLSKMHFQSLFNVGDHLHGDMWMEKAQHAFLKARGVTRLQMHLRPHLFRSARNNGSTITEQKTNGSNQVLS